MQHFFFFFGPILKITHFNIAQRNFTQLNETPCNSTQLHVTQRNLMQISTTQSKSKQLNATHATQPKTCNLSKHTQVPKESLIIDHCLSDWIYQRE